jgi:hypothetical protein
LGQVIAGFGAAVNRGGAGPPHALSNVRRHSGTPRSGEPGIHLAAQVWIPGSGLRPSPE